MDISRNYSFADLYRAAFDKEPSKKELLDLFSSPREQINATVKTWAGRAGWQTEERVGVDGQNYLAFFPKYNYPARRRGASKG
ncbi:MAG: hypothetical protein HY397_04040 [Candidatus Doudnabacteria bacterium]|nr:hypothetical protein [Candidatus Doudnabacteria bacterium]